MRRRAVLGTTVLLMLAASVACSRVPGASAPVEVGKVGGPPSSPTVNVSIPPPRPGETISQIVSGFLDASSIGAATDHSVAREYLTPRAAARWSPDAGATIYEGQPYVNAVGDNMAKLIVPRSGSLAANGSYTSSSGTVTELFHLLKVRGEYRITDPPNGLLVTATDFGNPNYFTQSNIYFLSPVRDVVVPDPRYFAVPPAARPNRLLQALLQGPSAWLAPAVDTDLPLGARLHQNVIASGSEVTVDLTGLGSLPAQQLRGLAAQVVWTLSNGSAATGTTVRLLQDGQPIVIPGVSTDEQASDWASYDPDTLAANSTLYVVDAHRLVTQQGPLAGRLGDGYYRATSARLSLDLRHVAVVTTTGASRSGPPAGGQRLYVGPTAGSLHAGPVGRSFTLPTWGGVSTVCWTVRNQHELVQVSSADGTSHVVSDAALAAVAPITAMSFSRDGTRVAVIGNGGVLYVGRVSRARGATTIEALRSVFPARDEFTAVTWASSTQLAGLAPGDASLPVLWSVAVDGVTTTEASNNGLPSYPVAVAAAVNQLTVVAAAQSMWYLAGNTWLPLPSSTNAPVDSILQGSSPSYPD